MCNEHQSGTVELARDARAVIRNFTSLHGESEMRAFRAESVDCVLVVDDQYIFIPNFNALTFSGRNFAGGSNLRNSNHTSKPSRIPQLVNQFD